MGQALHRQSLAKQGLEEFQDRHSRGEVPIGGVSEGSRRPSTILLDFVMEIVLVIQSPGWGRISKVEGNTPGFRNQ